MSTLAPLYLLAWTLSLVPAPKISMVLCCIPTAAKAFVISFLTLIYRNPPGSESTILKVSRGLRFLDVLFPREALPPPLYDNVNLL